MVLNFFKSKEARVFEEMDNLSNLRKRDRKIVKLIEGRPVASLDTPARLNINAQDEKGDTFLHKFAGLPLSKSNVYDDCLAADEYFLAKGADANILNKKGETPLKKCISTYNQTRLNRNEKSYHTALIEATSKENLNKVYPDGETILTDFAANNYHISKLKPVWEAFVRAGADVNVPNAKGKTPLRVLLDRMVKINLQEGSPFDSPHEAVLAKRVRTTELYEVVLYFIQNGAKITVEDNQALSKDLQQLNKDVAYHGKFIQLFVDLGTNYSHLSASAQTELAQKQLKTAQQISPLFKWLAVENKDAFVNLFADTFTTLLQDVNVKDENGRTPLFDVMEACNQHGVDILMKRGADIDVTANDGETLLHVAAKTGNTAMVEFILKNGKTSVNAQTNRGDTPLHVAAEKKELFDLLVQAGADWSIKNSAGQTPIDTIINTNIKVDYLSKLLGNLQEVVPVLVGAYKNKIAQQGNQNQKE